MKTQPERAYRQLITIINGSERCYANSGALRRTLKLLARHMRSTAPRKAAVKASPVGDRAAVSRMASSLTRSSRKIATMRTGLDGGVGGERVVGRTCTRALRWNFRARK